MNADPMQSKAGIAMEKWWKNSIVHSTEPVYIPVERLETQAHARNGKIFTL